MAAQHDLVGDAPKALLPNCDALLPGAQRCLSVLDKVHSSHLFCHNSLSIFRPHLNPNLLPLLLALHIGVLLDLAPNIRAPPQPLEAIGPAFIGQVPQIPNSTPMPIPNFEMPKTIAEILRNGHNSLNLGAILSHLAVKH